MTWLYVPPTSSASAQEQPDSILASESSWNGYAPFVTSSGKATQRPHSWRGWKSRTWIARLSGMTLAPSTASRGVEQWISSLRATRASHLAVPDSDAEQTTNGIFGHTLPALSTRFDRRSSSSKMSQAIFDLGFDQSEMTYNAWVSALQRDCTRRLRWARHTNASAYSSWPTPMMGDSEQAGSEGRKGKKQEMLWRTASMWPTPDASVGTGYNQSWSPNASVRPHLGALVKEWPTPNVSQAVQGQNNPDGKRGQTLIGAARGQQWQTPRSQEAGQYQFDPKMGVNKLTLDGQAQLWATPEATSGSNGGPNSVDSAGRPKLAAQAAIFGLHVQRMLTDGSGTSDSGRVLNPLFVEALMGWPRGWTDCDSEVTGLSQWLQQWRLWIFGDSFSIEVTT